MGSARYQASVTDRGLLAASLHDGGAPLRSEQFDDPRHTYLDELIPKPWDFEFRVYADDFYDVWELLLRSGHGTSLLAIPANRPLCCAWPDGGG